jgi:hypothetical protein
MNHMKIQMEWPPTHRFRNWRNLLVGTAMLVGCVGKPTVVGYTAPSTACCSSISEFQFRTPPLGQEVEFSLSPAESTYDFHGRRQHFIALKVPDGFQLTAVQVRTYLSTAYLPNATAVIPEFIHYGSDFQLLAKSSTSNFQTAGGFWRSGIAGRTQVPPGTKYIVVIAGDGGSGLPTVYSENRTPYMIPAAALGEFSLRLFGESVKK